MTASIIRYTIVPVNPAAHLFAVTVTVSDPDPAGQCFSLPAWIPGSYMIREFSRNIVSLAARARGEVLATEKIDKATWRCAPVSGEITLSYEVYAWDVSVRAAHLDETHGFFNGTSVFLLPLGRENSACEVDIQRPRGERFAAWQLATSLSQTPALVRLGGQNVAASLADAGVSQKATVIPQSSVIPAETGIQPAVKQVNDFGLDPGLRREDGTLGQSPKQFGLFTAANYDELIDHPVEMGTFSYARFEACGVSHHIAITGRQRTDLARLCADLEKICAYQIRLFEPGTAQAPMAEYWFLITAVGEGYGGLEHRASTALICNRDDLPRSAGTKVGKGYQRFLGLASHEYFHTWNVKRIKPAAFVPYDLTVESYTRQLWFFEGITSYYDDLVLVRTGLIDPLAYKALLAETISKVTAHSGRQKQSVAESSFDAWVKYYRQDENSPNAIVSYYQKGSMVGLALDLAIRERTQGAMSLDDVMRALWLTYGRVGIGVPEGAVESMAETVSGLDLKAFFAVAVHGTQDLDLPTLLNHVAIDMTWKVAESAEDAAAVSIGAKIDAAPNHDARITHVFDGGAAQRAGLSAGDTVVAVDGLRVVAGNFEKRFKSYPVGATVALTVFRRDEMMNLQLTLAAAAAEACVLTLRATPPAAAVALQKAWLGSH